MELDEAKIKEAWNIHHAIEWLDDFRSDYSPDDFQYEFCSTAIDALKMMQARSNDNARAERRAAILEEAIKRTGADRNMKYGAPEDNFRVIADLWERYIQASCVSKSGDVAISPRDVAMMMVLLKVGRAATADDVSDDTLVDIAGYAACAAGM
jgi:hypothetical protein